MAGSSSLSIMWPEVRIGAVARPVCPCGNVVSFKWWYKTRKLTCITCGSFTMHGHVVCSKSSSSPYDNLIVGFYCSAIGLEFTPKMIAKIIALIYMLATS